ncbi:MAG: DUF488 family protein [Oscillospiraceae bacterium]|nr:DUF488 family protein [Oscillospiraceae bacterium]
MRRRFGHQTANFPAFAEEYAAELDANPAASEFAALCAGLLRAGNVTLLYAAKDPQENNAAVLRGWLLKKLA